MPEASCNEPSHACLGPTTKPFDIRQAPKHHRPSTRNQKLRTRLGRAPGRSEPSRAKPGTAELSRAKVAKPSHYSEHKCIHILVLRYTLLYSYCPRMLQDLLGPCRAFVFARPARSVRNSDCCSSPVGLAGAFDFAKALNRQRSKWPLKPVRLH